MCATLNDRSVQVVVFRSAPAALEFLVLKRRAERGGFWQTVSGGIEDGEAPVDAAAREVREETGCDWVSLWHLTIQHEFAKEKTLSSGENVMVESHEWSVGCQISASAAVRGILK